MTDFDFAFSAGYKHGERGYDKTDYSKEHGPEIQRVYEEGYSEGLAAALKARNTDPEG